MKREKVIMVDTEDNVIGLKYRDEIDGSKDIHRCSAVWITNSKGEVLLAKRSHRKKINAGKWGPAVSGTISEGETYESNAYKEAEEEIGLKGVTFTVGPKQHFSSRNAFFGQWFMCVVDKAIGDFNIQEEEVDEIRWVGRVKLLQDMEEHPEEYTPSLKEVVGELVEF